jgi:hypothetical protein
LFFLGLFSPGHIFFKASFEGFLGDFRFKVRVSKREQGQVPVQNIKY